MSDGMAVAISCRILACSTLIYPADGLVAIVPQDIELFHQNVDFVQDGGAAGADKLHIKNEIAFGHRLVDEP